MLRYVSENRLNPILQGGTADVSVTADVACLSAVFIAAAEAESVTGIFSTVSV